MPSPIARGQISFVDLNDGKTLNFFLTSNRPTTQVFTPNANAQGAAYNPDYTTQAGRLIIAPEIFVSGLTGNQVSSLVQVAWKINGQAPGSAPGYTDSVIYYPEDGHRLDGYTYALEIKHNITGSHLVVECEAKYTDPDTGLLTPVKGEITFTKAENAGSSIIAVLTTPDGNIFRNEIIDTIRVHSMLWRGSAIDESNVEYTWFRRDAQGDDDDWEQITDGNAAGIQPSFASDLSPATPTPASVSFALKNCNQIVVPKDAILNYDVFKVVIKDVDANSDTYQQEVTDFVSVFDFTDPYMVSFETPAGTVLTKGQNSSTTTVTLWQNGQEVSPSFYSGCTFTWTKYDKNGNVVSDWGTGGHKTGRSLTVTRDEISVSATFAVEITIN